MRALAYFLPQFRRLTGPLLISLVLSLLTLATGIALLGISGWFLTAAALTTAGAAFNLFGPSAGVRGLSFTRILSRYGERLTGHDSTLRLLSDLRRWLFERLLGQVPIGARFGRADLVSRLIADLDALDTMFLVALGPMTTAALVGIGMSALLAWLLPAAAIAYGVGFALAVITVPLVLIASSRRAASEAATASANLRRSVLEGIDGYRDIVVFDAVADLQARIARDARSLSSLKTKLSWRASMASAAVQLLAGAVLVATLLVGINAVGRGAIDGALLAGLLLAVVASFEACAVLVRSAGKLAASAAAAERLVDVAEARAEITDPASQVALPPGADVEFDDVTFGYGDRNVVLEHLTLTVKSGDHVAIRGSSGAGKSTIAQLLVRLIEPRHGSVRINGTDVRDIALAELRGRVALMTQDAPVFGDTVRANLLIGRPGASDTDLWGVLKVVGLDDAIRGLPGQLDAFLGEAGAAFSAGQSRRICLARTLLSQAGIIILDEPTNGIDREAETAFLSDLPRLAAGRTLIVITHAEVPESFSRVLTLRNGRLSA